MNQLSWPTVILLGVLLGLAAVAAERTADDRPSASPPEDGATTGDQPDATGGGSGSGSGSGSSGGSSGSSGSGPGGGPEEEDSGTGGAHAVDASTDYALTLTFDDGPHPTYTPQVLELLDTYDATAVFCVVGQRVREHPELVPKIVEAGHALCNHTYTHDERLAERDRDEIDQEISDTTAAIGAATGDDIAVPYFRQPNTHVQPEMIPILEEHGLEPLDWNVDPRDWSRPGTASIVQGVLSQVRPGAVILLHDGGGDRSQTVAALEQILGGLDAAGYRYVVPGGDS